MSLAILDSSNKEWPISITTRLFAPTATSFPLLRPCSGFSLYERPIVRFKQTRVRYLVAPVYYGTPHTNTYGLMRSVFWNDIDWIIYDAQNWSAQPYQLCVRFVYLLHAMLSSILTTLSEDKPRKHHKSGSWKCLSCRDCPSTTSAPHFIVLMIQET
jgi:hypothetical protein